MNEKRLHALKRHYPEKLPMPVRIDTVVLATEGAKTRLCMRCKGTGARPDEKLCPICMGKGQVVVQEEVNLVAFEVNRCYLTKGNRLIVLCEGDKKAKTEQVIVDPRVEGEN